MTVMRGRGWAERTLPWLYLGNAAVLVTHEIDSAYWHEWELFGLPGGIQGFLGVNLILVVIILVGYRAVVLERAWAVVFAWVLVAGGLFAAIVHASFLLGGSDAFRLPASVALLAATLLLSVAQAAALLATHHRADRRAGGAGSR